MDAGVQELPRLRSNVIVVRVLVECILHHRRVFGCPRLDQAPGRTTAAVDILLKESVDAEQDLRNSRCARRFWTRRLASGSLIFVQSSSGGIDEPASDCRPSAALGCNRPSSINALGKLACARAARTEWPLEVNVLHLDRATDDNLNSTGGPLGRCAAWLKAQERARTSCVTVLTQNLCGLCDGVR